MTLFDRLIEEERDGAGKITRRVVTYNDDAESSFAIMSTMQWTLNLAAVDDWLEDRKWEWNARTKASRDQLVQDRSRAIQAFRRGDLDAATAWWSSIANARRYYLALERLLPIAQEAQGHQRDGRRKYFGTDAELLDELSALMMARKLSDRAAKSVLRQKYEMTSQGLNQRLRKAKRSQD